MVTPGPGRAPGRAQLLTATSGLVAFGLGVAGLALTRYTDTDAGPAPDGFDMAYRSLQLFVLDGGALAGLGPLHPLLQIARFVAPAVTVLAVLLGLRSLFANEWGRLRLSLMRGHIVICGDGREAAALARNVARAATGRQAVLVTTRPTGGPTEVRTVLGDPRDPGVLRAAGVARATAVYALADSSASSTAVAIAAGGVPRRGGRLAAYAQVRTENLVDGLRLRRIAGQPDTTAIDFFSVAEVAARALLTGHPPDGDRPVVVGTGELADAVARRIDRLPGHRAVSRPADTGAAHALAAHEYGPVYVCLSDADDAVACALRLATAPQRRVVLCLYRAAPFAEALGSAGTLSVFGALDDAWLPETIADDTVVSRTARAIHENYRAAASARQETPATNPSTVSWATLPDHLRASNVAQAEHIGEKLTGIGISLGYEPDDPPFAFTDAEIERLAQLEHRRWMTERRDAGFVYGPSRTGNQHPDLQDWDALTELARQKDRDTIRDLPGLLRGEGIHLRRATAR